MEDFFSVFVLDFLFIFIFFQLQSDYLDLIKVQGNFRVLRKNTIKHSNFKSETRRGYSPITPRPQNCMI